MEEPKMTESYRKWLEQLTPEEAERLAIEREKPNPGLEYLNRLYRRVNDGTATHEELAEYEERMSRYNDLFEGGVARKFYDDRA